ncbi:MAG: hypothetical protein QM628_07170 [Propionicimonas sp.]
MNEGAFIDVGKSGIRLQTVVDGVFRTYFGEGLSPTQSGNHGAALGRNIESLLAEAAIPPPEHLVIGSTGELTPTELHSLFTVLGRAIPEAVVALTDDGTLAHARFLNAPGTVLCVGTGVIAIARSLAGELRRFDGWGPLAGDRGSAVEVGRSALRSAHRAVDEGRSSELRDCVATRLGAVDLTAARAVLSDPRWPATLAGLALGVCELADAGVAEAAVILDAAATELHQTTRCAVAAAGVPGVVITGRFGTAAALRSRLEALFHSDGIRMLAPLPEQSVAAAEIMTGPYGPSMTFARAGQGFAFEGGH